MCGQDGQFVIYKKDYIFQCLCYGVSWIYVINIVAPEVMPLWFYSSSQSIVM